MAADYIGRFAPSPSGALHFGSLVAALGSYLQARHCQGRWLLRIEDIDPPRQVPGADALILRQLDHYGLHWDGEVLYQSARLAAYRHALHWLWQRQLCYRCDCRRERIRRLGGFYDGYCRQRQLAMAAFTDLVADSSAEVMADIPTDTCTSSVATSPVSAAAIRLVQRQPVYQFQDQLYGQVSIPPPLAQEDFILYRRDGLVAYNLAVVVDDHFQGITEVVRGADLLQPTARQISLYRTLGWQVPGFLHLPLVTDEQGNKLSKQNHAPPLPQGDARPLLIQALCFLRQTPPAGWQDLSTAQLLAAAIRHWQPAHLHLLAKTPPLH